VLENVTNENELFKVRAEVGKLTGQFPLYAWKLAEAQVAAVKPG